MKEIFYIPKYACWQQTEGNPDLDLSFVPPLIRRRLTQVEKIGLYLAHQLEPLPQNCQVVFASRFGEWQQTIDLIQQFFNDKETSPAGFSHSVHNAMPGLLSVLTKSKESYTSIAAKEATISSALLETFCGPKPVLFIYAEEKTPDFYTPKFSDSFLGHGVAFIVSSTPEPGTIRASCETGNYNNKICSFKELIDFLKSKDELNINGLIIRQMT